MTNLPITKAVDASDAVVDIDTVNALYLYTYVTNGTNLADYILRSEVAATEAIFPTAEISFVPFTDGVTLSGSVFTTLEGGLPSGATVKYAVFGGSVDLSSAAAVRDFVLANGTAVTGVTLPVAKDASMLLGAAHLATYLCKTRLQHKFEVRKLSGQG